MRISVGSFITKLVVAITMAQFAVGISIRGVPNTEKATFEFEDTAVMAPEDATLVRRMTWNYNSNQKLFMSTIIELDSVASAGCASGAPINCVFGVIYSVFTFFFSKYQLSDRAAVGEASDVFFVLPPTPETTGVERLAKELELNKWHDVGYVSVRGLNHTMQFYNNGTLSKLRARTATQDGLSVRAGSDPDNDGGFVGDFSWLTNNEGPYNSFHSTNDGTNFFAANAAGWIISTSHSIASCASFSDADGVLDNGLLTIGWNNQEFQWTNPGEEGAVFSKCASLE